ncbi:MAG: hypothetical protein Q8867_08720 [Bacteroidota bacterium]|nr:hypothetical protein [Bacteroidota bacterium]
MRHTILLLTMLAVSLCLFAQSPQKISYQAIIRNSSGKLIQASPVGIRVTILKGSSSGNEVYMETHNVMSNINGLVSFEIGGGIAIGSFSSIEWADGPYFIRTEIDPLGGTNYSVTSVNQLLSVPYALYCEKAGNGFSGDYNDLTNKPVTDGSETKVLGGTNIIVSGSGTNSNPYIINESSVLNNKVILTSSQQWMVPSNVSKLKVELWGAAGGGGGAGAYSYSYNLNNGGDGGSGGYSEQEMSVAPGQQYSVIIGAGGYAGNNAYYYYPTWYGDSDGGNGGDTWFGNLKAAGGSGGKRGSFYVYTINGNAGTSSIGTITGYSNVSNSNILDVFMGLPRSYIYERFLTSRPGTGGSLTGYSATVPKYGEGGCAIITFW